jgi:hypothetical protein
MGLFSAIGNFFKGLFNKIAKMWNLAKPFLQEVLSQTAQNALDSLQTLAIEAAQYVAAQGLPDDKSKQDAFKAYMINKAKDQVDILKDSELNLLREAAVAIVKKASS